MKRSLDLLLVLVMMAACHRHAIETTYVPSQRLVAIDTLMQSRPDSALTLLMDTTMQDPYYQLLLSEALYKNDYAQANRAELLEAMAYFDSIGDPFLAARCHYMNGVGYYEIDSVVPACAEYLKALEIMEEHFEEKELVGYKAKFMALTNTHLCSLFSNQYLDEQTIFFGKQALVYYQKYNAQPWHKAWILERIGEAYYSKAELGDSANWYFNKALDVLPDTNNQTYRDIVTLKAFLSYNYENNHESAIQQLNCILNQADNEIEFLSRYLILGDFYYQEKMWDSAWYYLNVVFNSTKNPDSKILSAQRLQDICQKTGDSLFLKHYILYLSQQANSSDVKASLHSQLTELYRIYIQNNLERQHRQLIKEKRIRFAVVLVGLLFVILILSFLYHRRNKTVGVLTNQIMEEQSLEKKKELFEQFLNEPICQNIILSMNGKVIKRTTVPQDYQELILSDQQLQQLALVVNRYFGPFENRLKQNGINPNPCLINLCHLCLLGMDEKQAAILLNRDYSSIKRYEKKLKNGFKTQEDLRLYLKELVINN